MTLLYANPLFQEHRTGAHPETERRLGAIDAALSDSGLAGRCGRGIIEAAAAATLTNVHASAVADKAAQVAAKGGGYLDPDTVVSARSYDVALAAAGSAAAAVRRVVAGDDKSALCLVRPPGHHATRAQSMGFCLFNNVAYAAKVAQDELGLDRILIVDWDVHHGNGTQDIFYDDPSVVFFSIHRHPFYPGTGRETETGSGDGLGATINVPVAFGTPRERYMDLFRAGLDRAVAKSKPQLILISAGFDAHAADPIGGLGLTTDDFATMTRAVQDAADVHAGGRIVSCLEGGYDLPALGGSVAAHLRTLLEGD